MSDYELNVGKKQTVNFRDIKEGIKKEEIAKEFWTIFDKIDTSKDNILQGNELERFLNAVEERAKRHNEKNLGFWEYRRVRKNLKNPTDGAPTIDLKGVKKKDLLAFINNLAHPIKPNTEQPAQEQQGQVDQEKGLQQEKAPVQDKGNQKVVKKGGVVQQKKVVKAREGDTLENIAEKNGVSVEDIKRANPNLGDAVKVGDEVTIPTEEEIAAAKAKEEKKAAEEKAKAEALKQAQDLGYSSIEEMKIANPDAFDKNGNFIEGKEIKSKATVDAEAAAKRAAEEKSAAEAAERKKQAAAAAAAEAARIAAEEAAKKAKTVKPDFWKGQRGKDWELLQYKTNDQKTARQLAEEMYKKEGLKANQKQIEERAKDIAKAWNKGQVDTPIPAKTIVLRTTKALVQDRKDTAKAKAIAKNLQKAADYTWGTDIPKLTQAIQNIKSPQMLAKVNKEIEAYVKKNCRKYGTQTNIEALIASEENHASARNFYNILIKNRALTNTQTAQLLAREFMYEIFGDTQSTSILDKGFDYTRSRELKKLMQMVPNRSTRVQLENLIKNNPRVKDKIKPNPKLDHGSYLRACLRKDGWSEQEIDRFDLYWVQSKAYDHKKDQQVRNTLVNRGLDYNKKEMTHAALAAVDMDNKADKTNVTQKAAKINKEQSHKQVKINGEVDQVQTLIHGRATDADGNIDAEQVAYCNTNLYKLDKPAEIQAHEAINYAKNGDFSKVFESSDPEFYNALKKELAGGVLKGIKTLQQLYDKALEQANNDNAKFDIKANALISKQVKVFNNDDEIVKFCIRLMHQIDKNEGFGRTTGQSASSTNVADKQRVQLQRIIQNYPNLANKIKAAAKKENFKVSWSITSAAGGASSTNFYEEDTKQNHLDLIKNTNRISSTAVDYPMYYEKNGKQVEIKDAEVKELLKNEYKNSLKVLRDTVAELKREVALQVGSEGWFSDAANAAATFSGVGTDRDDVKNQYLTMKSLLEQFEASIDGKLKDSNGNVISPDKFAKQVQAQADKLAKTNSDYAQSQGYWKMGIVLAPIIAVSAGAGSLISAGAAAVFGAGAATTATTVVGTAAVTGATVYGTSRLEMATSEAGSTIEGREAAFEEAVAAGAFVLGGSAFSKVSNVLIQQIINKAPTGLMARSASVQFLTNLTITGAGNGAIAAGSEAVVTGDVSINGVVFAVTFSLVGGVLTLKKLTPKTKAPAEPKPKVESEGYPSWEAAERGHRDPIQDGVVTRNTDTKHVNHKQRQMVEDALNDTPTSEEYTAYQKEIEYKAPTEKERVAIDKNNATARKASAESREIGNSSDANAEALEKARVNARAEAVDPNTKGIFTNDNAKFTVNNGKIVKIETNDGRIITDPLKIAKYTTKHKININNLNKIDNLPVNESRAGGSSGSKKVPTEYENIKAEFYKAPNEVNLEKVGKYAKSCASDQQLETIIEKLNALKGKEGVDATKLYNARRDAIMQLRTLRNNRAAAQRGVRNDKPTSTVEPKPTNEQGKTALEILSDANHQITSEEFSIIKNEIDNIATQEGLTISQRRGYLQSMYDGLASRPQSKEVVNLRAYIGEQMKTLKPIPVEAPAPETPKSSRFARVKQAASNYKTKALKWVKDKISNLRASKNAQINVETMPVKKMNLKQLRSEYERLRNLANEGKMSEADFARFKELDNRLIKKGITVLEDYDIFNGKTTFKFVKTNNNVSLMQKLFRTQAARAQKHWQAKYDAMTNEQLLAEYNKMNGLARTTQGRITNINTKKVESTWKYDPQTKTIDTAHGSSSYSEEFPMRKGLIEQIFKKRGVKLDTNLEIGTWEIKPKSADAQPNAAKPTAGQEQVVLEGRYTQITTRDNRVLRIGDSFKETPLCPEGQTYTKYETGADGITYRLEVENIGAGWVQVQDIEPIVGGTIIIGGGTPSVEV